MFDPSRIAEPRIFVMIISALVLVAAGLVFATGLKQPNLEAPVTLTVESAPRQAEAEAAGAACLAVATDAGCIIYVLERTRESSKMPAFAREYVRLTAR